MDWVFLHGWARKHLISWIGEIHKKKVVQRKPSKTNQTKLILLQILVTEQLNDDQWAYEEPVFQNGRFCERQKCFKSIRKSTQLPSEMYLEGEKTITDLQIAELSNKFFQPIFTQESCQKWFDAYAVIKIDKLQLTQTEVETALQNLPLGKTKGQDGLRKLPLKWTAWSPSVSLKLIFNTITSKRRFPAKWKTGNIIPLYKDGDKQCFSNYRVIWLFAFVS